MNLLESLKQIFGHTEFRGDQKEVVESILAGHNTLCLMPTGMGKSLCYQLPTKIQGGLTVVISPLIALMQDQIQKLKAQGFQAADIHSLLKKEDRENRYKKLAKGEYEIILVAPERFRKEEFLRALKNVEVKLLVIDEAHCVSEWGHDFRPDYTRIQEFRTLLKNPVTLMLTATATPEVQIDILKNVIGSEACKKFHSGIKRDNLNIHIHEVYGIEGKIEKYLKVCPELEKPQIIYFSLISTLEKFSEKLEKAKILHLKYHGGLPRALRQRNQKDFIKDGGLILATPAFGLGIDKSNIRTVCHMELPGSIESYYQEIGRAGRDGAPSQCHFFYDDDDIHIQMEFIKWAHPDHQFIRRVFDYLKNNLEKSNIQGLESIKEELHFKSSKDFRLETVLNLFDRWGVTEGDLLDKDLKFISDLPEGLEDKDLIARRLKNDQMKLLKLVQMIKSEDEKLPIIYSYFGCST